MRDFIEWVYPGLSSRVASCLHGHDHTDADAWFRDRAILTARNAESKEINDSILDMIDSETEFQSKSIDSVADPNGDDAVISLQSS